MKTVEDHDELYGNSISKAPSGIHTPRKLLSNIKIQRNNTNEETESFVLIPSLCTSLENSIVLKKEKRCLLRIIDSNTPQKLSEDDMLPNKGR